MHQAYRQYTRQHAAHVVSVLCGLCACTQTHVTRGKHNKTNSIAHIFNINSISQDVISYCMNSHSLQLQQHHISTCGNVSNT